MKLVKLAKPNANLFTIKGIFQEDIKDKVFYPKKNFITEDITSFTAYCFLGKKSEYNYSSFKGAVKSVVNYHRASQIDVASFVHGGVTSEIVVREMTEAHYFEKASLFSAKTADKDPLDLTKVSQNLVNYTKADEAVYEEAVLLAKIRNEVRTLQMTPPNYLNSENYAKQLADAFKDTNVKVTVLNKAAITKHKMGLLLGVNAGSEHEPRVVVLEYRNGGKNAKTTALVGKGVMFDAGGYNIKTGSYMSGMKFDMSGSAVVYGAIKALSSLKVKANVVAVLPLTDNKINSAAITADTVLTSMNGKTVEINNTDAEGRLILADAITYAIRELKADSIIDVATLTGAVLVALGNTFTGVWATDNDLWKRFRNAAEKMHENVWRLPLHADFEKGIKDSKVADLKNADTSGKGGSSSAAAFILQFTENKPYIHCDIAGTADIAEMAYAPLVKTIVEYIRHE